MDTNKFTGLLLFTVAVIMLAPQAFAFGKSEEIGCNGKDFLCFNESSFYVCVDTGGTDTVAEGELQHCLWGLVCRNSSIYECEEPHYVVTTTFKPENNTTEEDNFTVETSTSTQTETNDSNIKTTTNIATTKDGYSTTENKIGTSDSSLETNTQHTDTETYKTDGITNGIEYTTIASISAKDEFDSTTESAKVTITSCMDDSPGGTGTVNHSCRGTPDTSLSTTQINNETTTVSANSQTNSSDNTTIPDKLITTETSLMENTTINEDLLTTNKEENASRETTNVALESTTQKFTSTTQDNGNTHDSITETKFVSNSNNDETTESFENTTQFDQNSSQKEEEATTKNQGSTKANNSETTSGYDSSTSSENISTNKNDNSNASSSKNTMEPSENTTPFEERSTSNETSDRSDSTSPIDQYTTSNISTEPTNQTNPTRDHENTESNTFSGPTTIFGSNVNGTSTTVKAETETIGSHQLSTRENERTEVTTFSPNANNNSKTTEYTSIAHESTASNPGNNTEQTSDPNVVTQSTIEYDTTIHSTKPDIENHLSTYENDGSTKQTNATLAQESSTTTVPHIDNETASTSVPSDTAAPISNENRTTEREDVTASGSLTKTHESSPLHEGTTTSTNPNRESTTTVHTDAVSNSTDSIRDTTSKINPTSAHEDTKSTGMIQTSTVTSSITTADTNGNEKTSKTSTAESTTAEDEIETTNNDQLSTGKNDGTEVPGIIETSTIMDYTTDLVHNSIPHGSTTQNQVDNATKSSIGYSITTTDDENRFSTYYNETTGPPEIINTNTVSGSNHDTTTSTQNIVTTNNYDSDTASTTNNNSSSTTSQSKLTTIGITTESITNSVSENNNDITSNSSVKGETSTTETETTNNNKLSTRGNDETEVTTSEYKASSGTEDNSIPYESTTQNQVGNATESTIGYGTITTGLPEQTDYESQLSTHSNETTELPEIMNSTTVSGSNHDSTTSTTANYDSGTASSTHNNNFGSTTYESELTTIGITTESITNSVPEDNNDITSNSSIKGETSTTETETTNDSKLSTREKDKTEVTAMHESTTSEYKASSGTEDNSIPYESTTQNQVGNATESTIGYGTITTGLPEQTDYESQLSTHSNETTELPEIMNSTTVPGSNHDSTTSTTANYDSGIASSTRNNNFSSTTSESKLTTIGKTTESITNSVPEDNNDITSNSSVKGETSTTETETTNDNKLSTRENNKTKVTAMHESTTDYKASSGTEDNSIPYESTTQNQVGNVNESTIEYGTITTGLPEQTDYTSQLSTHFNETTELPEIMNSTTVSGSNHDTTTSTTANYDSGTASSTHNKNFSSTTSQNESTMIGITTNFPVHGETSTTEIKTTKNNEISTHENNKTEGSEINKITTPYYQTTSGFEDNSTPHESITLNQENDIESTTELLKQTDYENQLSTHYNEPTQTLEITNTNRVSGSNTDSTTPTQNIVTTNNIDSDATSTTNNSYSSSTTPQNESTINIITTESVKNSVPEDNNDITSNFSVDEETSTTRTVTTNNNKFSTSENDKTEVTAMPDYKTSSGTEDNSIPHDRTTLNPVGNTTESTIGYDSITTGLPEQTDYENQPSTNGSTEPPEILATNAPTQDYNPNSTSTTHNKQNSTTTQSETTMIEITTENITNFVTEDNNNITSNSSVDEGTSTTKTETTNDNKLSTSENDKTKLTAMHESTTLDYKASSETEDNSIPYESTTQNPVVNSTESTIGHDSITTGQPEQTDYENQFSTRYNGSTEPPGKLNTNTVSSTQDIITTNNFNPNPTSTTHNKQSSTTSQSETTMNKITTENITNTVSEGNNSSVNGEISTTEPRTTNNNKLPTRENDKTEVMDKSTTPDYKASSGTEDNSISYDSTTQNQVGNAIESTIEYGTATAGLSTHYKGTTHYDETTEPSDIMKTNTSIYSSNPDSSTMQAIVTSTNSITFESTTIGITEGGITNSLPENDNTFVTTNTALPYVNDSASTKSIQFTTLRENITNTVKVTTKNTNIENHKTESPTQVTTTMKQETISSPTVSDGEEPSTNRITEGPYTTEQIPTKVITGKYNTQTTKKYQQTDHSTSTVATTDSKLDSKTSIVTDDRHLITITDESSEEISEEYTEETDFSDDYSDESSDADELTTVPIEEAKTTLSSTQRPQTTFPSIDSEFECSKAGKFADKYNCHIFYLCIRMKNGYRKLPYPCPSGTIFDPKRKYCSVRNKKCDTVFTCESSGFFPDPEHESKFYICFYNSLSHEFLVKHITCPGRAIFDADKQICVYAKLDVSSEEDDSEEFVCGDVGKFPVQDNCQYYYLCIFKRHEFKISMKKCPKNKLFDRNSRICRYKNFVKCDDYNK